MNASHLTESILTYDNEVKKFDKEYVKLDKKALNKFVKSDVMTKEEMRNIFGQQVRKIMTKQVKSNEKFVSKSV